VTTADGLSASDALAAWLQHLAHERRASPRTVEAYAGCVRAYLAFWSSTGARPSPPRRWAASPRPRSAPTSLASAGGPPLSPRSLSQALSAIRSFHRWLDRRLGVPTTGLALVRGPRLPATAPRPGV
jgi:integrase/recombinase XerC